MPVDFYLGKSTAELLDLLKKVQARQANGNLTEFMGAGIRGRRDFQGASATETEIIRLQYSLYLRDQALDTPTGDYPNPYDQRVRSTRARYRFS